MAAIVRWCLTHDREVRNRFVAAVCPNEPGCQVVPRPVENGRDANSLRSVETPDENGSREDS